MKPEPFLIYISHGPLELASEQFIKGNFSFPHFLNNSTFLQFLIEKKHLLKIYVDYMSQMQLLFNIINTKVIVGH